MNGKTIKVNSYNKQAVIYCRVSSRDQVEEGNSLASQEKICKEYAFKNGYQIARVFIEKGESAKTADRTQLRELIAYCSEKTNLVSAVIVYKLDRLSRNTDDYSVLRVAFKRLGIDILSTSEYFENTPSGRFLENIIANVAQFDNDVRTERSVGGMKEAAREGRYVWSAPLGYSNVRIAGRATIAQNEMAGLVRKIFEEVAKNTSTVEEVRLRMAKEGFVNKKGKQVGRSYFYKMLKDETYAGWIIKFGERNKGLFEPIVSEELFEQVQRVLKYRGRRHLSYTVENPDFPLRRFISHSSGAKLTGAWSKGRSRYYAYYRFNPNIGMSLLKEQFEEQFRQFMDSYRLSKESFKKLKEYFQVHYIKATTDQREERKNLENAIEEMKAKQNKLIEKNIKGVISDTILRQQLEHVDKEIMKLSASLAQMPDNYTDLEKALDVVEEFLLYPSAVWQKAPFAQKLKLQWFKFPSGVVYDGEKFGTAEIRSIFKAESLFLPPLSMKVPLRNTSWNHQKSLKDCSLGKISPSDLINLLLILDD